MGWAEWWKIVLGAGAGSAAIQALVAIWSAHRLRYHHAAHMGLRLAIALELFALESAQRIRDNQYAHQGPDDEYPDWTFRVPSAPTFPEDVEGWRSVSQAAASDCLSFEQRVLYCQEQINSHLDYAEPDDDLYAKLVGALALDAVRTSKSLRLEYGLREARSPWDFADYLEDRVRKASALPRD